MSLTGHKGEESHLVGAYEETQASRRCGFRKNCKIDSGHLWSRSKRYIERRYVSIFMYSIQYDICFIFGRVVGLIIVIRKMNKIDKKVVYTIQYDICIIFGCVFEMITVKNTIGSRDERLTYN